MDIGSASHSTASNSNPKVLEPQNVSNDESRADSPNTIRRRRDVVLQWLGQHKNDIIGCTVLTALLLLLIMALLFLIYCIVTNVTERTITMQEINPPLLAAIERNFRGTVADDSNPPPFNYSEHVERIRSLYSDRVQNDVVESFVLLTIYSQSRVYDKLNKIESLPYAAINGKAGNATVMPNNVNPLQLFNGLKKEMNAL